MGEIRRKITKLGGGSEGWGKGRLKLIEGNPEWADAKGNRGSKD